MEELVGSREQLEEWNSLPEAERRLTPPIRGVLAEIAATGLVRYEWALLRPLLAFVLEAALLDYEADAAVEVGPAAPLAGGETPAGARKRLGAALGALPGPPWTLQRLAELLLEPHKQYTRLDKLALAVEKLLYVTSTVAPAAAAPPRPALRELPPINENPPAVRPPGGGSPRANGHHPPAEPGLGLAGALLAPSATQDEEMRPANPDGCSSPPRDPAGDSWRIAASPTSPPAAAAAGEAAAAGSTTAGAEGAARAEPAEPMAESPALPDQPSSSASERMDTDAPAAALELASAAEGAEADASTSQQAAAPPAPPAAPAPARAPPAAEAERGGKNGGHGKDVEPPAGDAMEA